MSVVRRLLWLVAAWKVLRGRLYLASRALLGVPGEVILAGPARLASVEVRGPTALRLRGPVTAGSFRVGGGSTVGGE